MMWDVRAYFFQLSRLLKRNDMKVDLQTVDRGKLSLTVNIVGVYEQVKAIQSDIMQRYKQLKYWNAGLHFSWCPSPFLKSAFGLNVWYVISEVE